MNKKEGGKKGLALSEQENEVLMSPFLVMNPEPSLHQKTSFPELAIWKLGSSELEPTGASQRRISSVSSLSFVLRRCHWQKTGEIKKVPFNLLSGATGPVIHSTNLLNILYPSYGAKWQERNLHSDLWLCIRCRKSPSPLYTSLLKGVWMQTQNQTKHTRIKNRGLLMSWNQLSFMLHTEALCLFLLWLRNYPLQN